MTGALVEIVMPRAVDGSLARFHAFTNWNRPPDMAATATAFRAALAGLRDEGGIA